MDKAPPSALSKLSRISTGFYLDCFFAWGKTYYEVKTSFPLGSCTERFSGRNPICSVHLMEAYGVPVVHGQVMASNEFRPVTYANYEIDSRFSADLGAAFNRIEKMFSEWIGPPLEIQSPVSQIGPIGSGSVIHCARWIEDSVILNCSIYGEIRTVPGGFSLGCLSLNWEDPVSAGKPYMAELLASEKRLADLMPEAEVIAILPLGYEPKRFGTPNLKNEPFDSLKAKSRACTIGINILETPASLQERLTPATIAIWRWQNEWGFSNYWDTSIFRGYTRASYTKLRPAKGGGSSSLDVGNSIHLRGPWQSIEIDVIFQVLRSIPHVAWEIVEDEDY